MAQDFFNKRDFRTSNGEVMPMNYLILELDRLYRNTGGNLLNMPYAIVNRNGQMAYDFSHWVAPYRNMRYGDVPTWIVQSYFAQRKTEQTMKRSQLYKLRKKAAQKKRAMAKKTPKKKRVLSDSDSSDSSSSGDSSSSNNESSDSD